MSNAAARDRALLSLQGLAVGDALGGFYEFAGSAARQRIAARWLPNVAWHWTDDTQMAGAIVQTLIRSGTIDQQILAEELAARYERSRGYGMATRALLSRLRRGAAWQTEAPALFNGGGSFGNGATSRVPPLGAYFSEDLATAAEQAARSAVVTHAHLEAQAGAIAVAILAALFAQNPAPQPPAVLLDQVLGFVPDTQLRTRLMLARDLPEDCPAEYAAAQLGNGTKVSAQDTVPFALWCAARPHSSFADAIWYTLEGLGDCDTTCAIVGGIVALRYGPAGIPAPWLESCEALPSIS